MEKKKFAIQMAIFLTFALILPIAFILIKFKSLLEIKTIRISVGMLLAIGVVFGVVGFMIKYYVSGLKTKHTLLKQVLNGLTKVILPICLVLLIAIFFKNKNEVFIQNIDNFIITMWVILICESVAVVVNPLPKWAFENNVEGLSEIADKIFTKKEEGE